MTSREGRYSSFALCREMLETPLIIRMFDPGRLEAVARIARHAQALMLTGEGSSRLFPAKRTRAESLRSSGGVLLTEGATQCLEYDLSSTAVLGASNSGRTRELVRLFQTLKESGHDMLAAITTRTESVISQFATTHVLACGAEEAVAATKSVVEEALAWQAVAAVRDGGTMPDLAEGADAFETVLTATVPDDFAHALASGRMVFFSGRNDGVAEELALKANEIVRRPSQYLEGTYAVHGIEEVMTEADVVVLIEPFREEEETLWKRLTGEVGATVIALADRPTVFPTLQIPYSPRWRDYLLLAAGWNLLVEAGLEAGVDLDHPLRARKVGNDLTDRATSNEGTSRHTGAAGQ